MKFTTTTQRVSILFIIIFICIITIISMGVYINNLHTKVNNLKQDKIKYIAKSNKYQSLYYKESLSYQYSVIEVGNRLTELAERVEDTYYMEDINLSKDLQQYAYKMADKYNIEYSTALAVMKLESRFDTNAFNDNGGSNDYGLFQLNNIYGVPWASQIIGRPINRYNIYDNIEGGIAILSKVQITFKQYPYLDSNPFKIAIQAYNRGIGGSKIYYRKYGAYHVYVDRILEFKKDFDKE